MPAFDRLTGPSDWIDLDSVERDATPELLMKLSIHLHAAVLSLADTVSVLEEFGVKRARSTVHNWVRTADLEPSDGKRLAQVATDETVIPLNDQRFWLSAALAPIPPEFLQLKLYPIRTIDVAKRFLSELCDERHVEDAEILVDARRSSRPRCSNAASRSGTSLTATATPSNVSSRE